MIKDIEKRREYQRLYKEKNRDKINAYKREAYRKKNPIVKAVNWYIGHRGMGICRSCNKNIHSKPLETCIEPKHFNCFHNKRTKDYKYRTRRRKDDPYYGTGVTKEQWVIKNRDYRRSLRFELLIRFGNKCSRCGFDDYRALQIDHKKNNGGYERKKYTWKLSKMMLKMSNEELHENYQLLCANCHTIKTYNETWFKHDTTENTKDKKEGV